jgi:hypothetical protein
MGPGGKVWNWAEATVLKGDKMPIRHHLLMSFFLFLRQRQIRQVNRLNPDETAAALRLART